MVIRLRPCEIEYVSPIEYPPPPPPFTEIHIIYEYVGLASIDDDAGKHAFHRMNYSRQPGYLSVFLRSTRLVVEIYIYIYIYIFFGGMESLNSAQGV